MKSFLLITMMFICFAYNLTSAQEKTVEKKITTDSKGKVDSTESVIISSTEDITPRNNMLIINPLKFFLFYNLSYYRKINNTIAVGGGFQLPTISETNGFGINAEVRIHPSQKALRGFYIAPNISLNSISFFGDNNNATLTSIGALVGWQWFPGDEFAMGLGIGIDQYFISKRHSGSSNYDGTFPAVRFDIGYAW